MDLTHAYTQIDKVKKIISDLRKESVKEFEPLFEPMLAMVKNANSDWMEFARNKQQGVTLQHHHLRTIGG